MHAGLSLSRLLPSKATYRSGQSSFAAWLTCRMATRLCASSPTVAPKKSKNSRPILLRKSVGTLRTYVVSRTRSCTEFCQTWEQFRLKGAVTVVSKDESSSHLMGLREMQWNELSPNSRSQVSLAVLMACPSYCLLTRRQFASPAPGLSPHENAATPTPKDVQADIPHDNYVLLLLQPRRVDHLCLKTSQRTLHSMEGTEWQSQCLNP